MSEQQDYLIVNTKSKKCSKKKRIATDKCFTVSFYLLYVLIFVSLLELLSKIQHEHAKLKLTKKYSSGMMAIGLT